MNRKLVAKAARLAVEKLMPRNQQERDFNHLDDYEKRRSKADIGRGMPGYRGGSGIRASVEASLDTGAKRGTIDQAIAVLKKRPDLFARFEAGEITLHQAHKQIPRKRRSEPLTAAERGATIVLARFYVETGQRRCPGVRVLQDERKAVPVDIALFKMLYKRFRAAYDAGKLDAAVAAAMDLI